MNLTDRARLQKALQGQVASIAAEMGPRLRDRGPVRTRAERLHADEKVGEDFEVWTELLARRAAVLWVLKLVYVRVLEDRGLLQPGRLFDPEAQQLFEKLAPNLGESAFLRWIFRDLASDDGGLPELFAPQPAELLPPSDASSRALIELFRHKDADTGAHFSFGDERFDGELMGDLYQELDPVVKERFALCQTPDFVRSFMLDRTLTPAMEEFGADKVRLLDPACGSGHFLIDGLKRLVEATAKLHPDWSREQVVRQVLPRVVGVDLNDYACGLARARLVMTAAELAGLKTLAEAATLHPHIYWADGLEQVEREEAKPVVQTDLFAQPIERTRATLTRADVRAALKEVYAEKLHAVVANPPYILERDEARREYHKELLGKDRRYVSATGKYSLGAPFTERCFQLAEKAGFVGIITSNNFMKREFGKALIERVLRGLDLTLIVDSSQAYIPHHGTPTVMLFGRNRRPEAEHVRVVMGKRGETGTPEVASKGKVWSSIESGWATRGFENEYLSVADLSREALSKHPWAIGGGGAAELKDRIEAAGSCRLSSLLRSIGFASFSGLDDAFLLPSTAASTMSLESAVLRPMALGESVRDWTIFPIGVALAPYDQSTQLPIDFALSHRWGRYLWRFRRLSEAVISFGGKTRKESGDHWWEWYRWQTDRYLVPLALSFGEVATHNHFALDRGGKVFKQTAPVIKLPPGATEDEHLALLGLLNSAAAEFWMKQIFFRKGGDKTGEGGRRAVELWHAHLQRDSTKMNLFPVAPNHARSLPYARRLDALARERADHSIATILETQPPDASTTTLRNALDSRRRTDTVELHTMIALQEELDWLCYSLYGLDAGKDVVAADAVTPVPPTSLPWCVRFAARDAEQRAAIAKGEEPGELPTDWFTRHGWEPQVEFPEGLPAATRARFEARRKRIDASPELALIENANCKRRWYRPDYESEEQEALRLWLADRVEAFAKARAKPFALAAVVAALQDEPRVLAVAELITGRKDFSLSQLVNEALAGDAVPNHRFHVYKSSGLLKRAAWERTWADQRREDAGEKVTPDVPPTYGSGDFLRPELWQHRGKLDVPKERFIAFTEVPGRTGAEVLYGWAGWTPEQRCVALLELDEELDEAGVALRERLGLLDSAFHLLPDVARDAPAKALRLQTELASLVGPTGPSDDSMREWQAAHPPPRLTLKAPPKARGKAKSKATDEEEA